MSEEKGLGSAEATQVIEEVPSASDEVGRMVHAFGDPGRKDAVRKLALRVERIEVERNALRVEVDGLRRERARKENE